MMIPTSHTIDEISDDTFQLTFTVQHTPTDKREFAFILNTEQMAQLSDDLNTAIGGDLDSEG